MSLVNQRILLILSFLKNKGTINTDKEFCESIGLLKQNLIRIKRGQSNFTAGHILKMSFEYGANPSWIFGVGEKMFVSKEIQQKIGVNKAVNTNQSPDESIKKRELQLTEKE